MGIVLLRTCTRDLIHVAPWHACFESFDVGAGLYNIAVDIEGISWGLGNGEPVVQCNTAWNRTKANHYPPHSVNSKITRASALIDSLRLSQSRLVGLGDNKRYHGRSKLPYALHCENGCHHSSSPSGRCELGRDDGTEWVVTTDTDTHEYSPEDDDSNNAASGRVCRQ